MQSEKLNITIFVGITTLLILMLGTILILVIYLYQQKKLIHLQSLKELELSHDKNIVNTQLEVQENMFRHISQEIHDNIGLTLSLVKLRLNTITFADASITKSQVNSSILLLGESIDQLKDISRSLNADIINSYGLIGALEKEIQRIRDVSKIGIEFNILGNPIYMDSQKELIIFRIIQEAFNNIIKHSGAQSALVSLNFLPLNLEINISDDGKGFSLAGLKTPDQKGSAGLKNMEARCKMIRGVMQITSSRDSGTTLQFIIPL